MNRRRFGSGLLALLTLPLALCAAERSAGRSTARSAGIIARGTRWATPYFVQDTGLAGPTVLVTGGVHGNEPAGARAAGQIRHWTLTRGKLVVVPRANHLGLVQGTRAMPDAEHGDLNRNFPKAAGDPPRGELAAALWAFVAKLRPAWLLDLHESAGFRKQDKKRTGNSVIHYPGPVATPAARRLVDAANATVTEPEKEFVLLRSPVKGSLARAAAERLGVRAMILETKWPKQPLSLRVRQHRVMVHRLLTDLDMVSGGVDVLFPLRRSSQQVRIALYDAGGAGGSGIPKLDAMFRSVAWARIERVGPAEVLAGALSQADVLIVPGGSASKEARAISPPGREAIRRFVRGGGGYVGLCAGAYLAASNYTWSLKILDAKVIDRKHWRRGKALVKVELTAEGLRRLGGRPGLFDVRYANGPLLAPAERADIPDYTPLAHFRSEVAKNGAPTGVMINTPAMVAGLWGKGRVFVSSPHPESTPGLAPTLVQNAVLWAAGRPRPGRAQ